MIHAIAPLILCALALAAVVGVAALNTAKVYEPTSAEVVKVQRRAPPSIWIGEKWVRVDQLTDDTATELQLYAEAEPWNAPAVRNARAVAKFRAQAR